MYIYIYIYIYIICTYIHTYIYIYCILYILSSDRVRTMTPSTTHLGSIFQFPGSKGRASHHCPSKKMAEIPLLLKIPNTLW